MTLSIFEDEDVDALEGEEDLDRASADQVRGVSTFTTDWTVETILSQIDKGNIMLDPKWQRRDAWNINRKSDLIESVILNYPVPPIVLAETKGQRGKYIVIDGKQRLLTLRQFSARRGDPLYRPFRLSRLPTLVDIEGATLESLKELPGYRPFVDQFENYPIRTVIVRGWGHETILYSIFLRLNAGSAKLHPQELRQALHPGPFIDFVDEFASNSQVMRSILNIKAPDFRMRDNELALRYFAFQNFIQIYDGNLKSFLDQVVFLLNDDWESWRDDVESQIVEFNTAHDFAVGVFDSTNPYRKFKGRSYELRLNRAVFDIMMMSFSNPAVREELSDRKAEIKKAYENLCTVDAEFLSSLESTTKSVAATKARIFKWAQAINILAGRPLLRPVVSGEALGLGDGLG